MAQHGRLVAVILEVSDLDSSAMLYPEAWDLDLYPGDNGVDDGSMSGRHTEISWRDGAYLHFALYPAKEKPTTGAQITLSVEDVDIAHAAAVRAGAQVLHAPRTEPWGRSGRYKDLDGNVIELTQHT